MRSLEFQEYGGPVRKVILRGSRSIKVDPFLKDKRALALVTAHRMAQVALEDLGIEVLQYRAVRAAPKENAPRREYSKKRTERAPHRMVLVGKRIELDARTRHALHNYAEYRLGNISVKDYLNIRTPHHSRFEENLFQRIAKRLRQAGIRSDYVKEGSDEPELDIGSHNIGITPSGKRVLLELIQPYDVPSFRPPSGNELSEDQKNRLREIVAEHKLKLKEIK